MKQQKISAKKQKLQGKKSNGNYRPKKYNRRKIIIRWAQQQSEDDKGQKSEQKRENRLKNEPYLRYMRNNNK